MLHVGCWFRWPWGARAGVAALLALLFHPVQAADGLAEGVSAESGGVEEGDREHFSSLLDSIDGLPEREQLRELKNHLETHVDCPERETIRAYEADLLARRQAGKGVKRRVSKSFGDSFESPLSFASAALEPHLSAGVELGLPGWGAAALHGAYPLTQALGVLGSLGGEEGSRVVTLEARYVPGALQREGQRLSLDLGVRGELSDDSLLRVETRVHYALRPELSFLPELELQAMGGVRVRMGAPFSARVLTGVAMWYPVLGPLWLGVEATGVLRPILATRRDVPDPIWMTGRFFQLSLCARYRVSEALSVGGQVSKSFLSTLTLSYELAAGVSVEYLF